MGAQANDLIGGYLRKKAFFLRFLDFPKAARAFWKRANKNGRFRLIFRKGGQTPLEPPFVSEPSKRGRKIGAARKLSKSVEKYF